MEAVHMDVHAAICGMIAHDASAVDVFDHLQAVKVLKVEEDVLLRTADEQDLPVFIDGQAGPLKVGGVEDAFLEFFPVPSELERGHGVSGKGPGLSGTNTRGASHEERVGVLHRPIDGTLKSPKEADPTWVRPEQEVDDWTSLGTRRKGRLV